MDTTGRTKATSIALAGMLLASFGFCVSDASAQARSGNTTMPRHSSGLRVPAVGGHSVRHESNSSGFGRQGVNMIDSAGRYHGNVGYHGSNHHGYSDAEACRDVGMANAVVGLMGTFLGAYNYAPYPAYPVAVIPSPRVIVERPPYWCAPPSYRYAQPDFYPWSYWNLPVYQNVPYGYWDGYYPQYRGSYDRGYPSQYRRSHDYDGNYRRPGTWQGSERIPAYRGRDIQSLRSGHQSGTTTHVAPDPSRYRRGSQPAQHAPTRPLGRS